MIKKHDAIEKLRRQQKLIDYLKSKPSSSSDFEKWHRDTQVAIENIFGNETRHLGDFNNISYSLLEWEEETPNIEFDMVYYRGLDRAHSVLESMIDEISEYWKEQKYRAQISKPDPVALIENVCNRFYLVARQIQQRYNKRRTIIIEDEYDVQDLIYAILRLYFDDIREEEWTPSYSARSSRIDFLLKKENIVIEVKKTSENLVVRHVADQLIIDIERYKVHPGCKTLICFVYDPENRISNPTAIENDLSKEYDDLLVKVIVSPK